MSNQPRHAAPGNPPLAKLAYIDAVRGWAVLLVMTSHIGAAFPLLPYPVRKLTNFGWFGVQLFFLASAITLALSWTREHTNFVTRTRHFFLRRFLRIAPMYYAGALFYAMSDPPAGGIDPVQLLRSLTFTNAWAPAWTATTPDGWRVVPGGWSISVEFTFYACFPLLISVITTWRRAALFVLISALAATALNEAGLSWYGATHGAARANFLYFWFPDQLPVFAAGLLLFQILPATAPTRQVRRYIALAGLCAACVLAAEYPQPADRFVWGNWHPQLLIATTLFAGFIYALAGLKSGFLVNKLIRHIGVLSFSCYVLHFFFVDRLPLWTARLIDTDATGLRAVLLLPVLWLAVVGATVLAAEFTHRWIELPGIRLARRLTKVRKDSSFSEETEAKRLVQI